MNKEWKSIPVSGNDTGSGWRFQIAWQVWGTASNHMMLQVSVDGGGPCGRSGRGRLRKAVVKCQVWASSRRQQEPIEALQAKEASVFSGAPPRGWRCGGSVGWEGVCEMFSSRGTGQGVELHAWHPDFCLK